jgi:signal transduction histidine kinase
MGSSRALTFAAGVAIRAALIGALAFAAAALAAWLHYYASAAVVLGGAALVGLDLARGASAADRTLAQFVDGLSAEGFDRPGGKRAGAGRLGAAIERALDELGRVRAARQRRLDYLQALIDTVAAAVLVADPEGRIEFANRAARQRFGEADRLDQSASLGAYAARALVTAPAGSRRMLVLASGERALASVGAFASAEGPRRLIALQGLAADLDAVEQEAWRDLTRILAHEMMNSLTPICSLAESLAGMGESAPAARQEALEVIRRRSAGLMSFVERYRRLAELPTPEPAALAAPAFVADLDALMGALAAERGVAYESVISAPDLMLWADPDLLEQAVINLLKNAVDAADGQPEAKVRLLLSADEGGASIVVADNGPGLAPAEAEAAFAPFFTTKVGGSGVGLSLARQIALAHGGRLEHQPARRGGAAFRLFLPRDPSSA